MTTPTKATSDGRALGRGLRPDLQCAARIDRMLAKLTDGDRRRVLQWMADRHAEEDLLPARYKPAEAAHAQTE